MDKNTTEIALDLLNELGNQIDNAEKLVVELKYYYKSLKEILDEQKNK